MAAGALGWLLWSTLRPKPSGPAAGIPDLRLCGSNTIGGELAPALVDAFFTRRGARSIERKQGATPRQTLLSTGSLTVSIEAAGTATGLDSPRDSATFHGLAADERQRKSGAASRKSAICAPATERHRARRIAVIVPPATKCPRSSRPGEGHLHGRVRDWSAVAGGPPHRGLRARRSSGTRRDGGSCSSGAAGGSAKRFVDGVELSDNRHEPRDRLVSLLRPLGEHNRISANITHLPSPFTVANESYPLSRRLYFYTLPHPRTPLVTNLVNFAHSPEGQQVVRESGYVDLSIAGWSPGPCDARCPPAYAAATLQARRLTVDFRFRPGTEELDSLASRNLDRLVAFVRTRPGAQLLLLGFADDLANSVARANQVAGELERRGVRPAVVKGFGAAMPVSSRTDAQGRQRNRRVEAWIRDAEGAGPDAVPGSEHTIKSPAGRSIEPAETSLQRTNTSCR